MLLEMLDIIYSRLYLTGGQESLLFIISFYVPGYWFQLKWYFNDFTLQELAKELFYSSDIEDFENSKWIATHMANIRILFYACMNILFDCEIIVMWI